MHFQLYMLLCCCAAICWTRSLSCVLFSGWHLDRNMSGEQLAYHAPRQPFQSTVAVAEAKHIIGGKGKQ